jgi:transcriptional regulator
MNKQEFVEYAALLGERQAEAWYLRRVKGVGRQEAAAEMGTSASNVDNLERAAYDKIIRAGTLMSVVNATDVDVDHEIGVCGVCDEPSRTLKPHPDDEELEDARMIFPSCHHDAS